MNDQPVPQDSYDSQRMFTYTDRLFDRYHRLVASLAVLGDQSKR